MMKKLMVLSIICLCSVCAFPGFAADADEISVSLLKGWASEKYGCRIDGDGDLILNTTNGKIIVSVIPKAKLIRFWCAFEQSSKYSRDEMVRFANKFNHDTRFLRVCIDDDGDAICDYYIVYDGGLDSKNFLEALRWFTFLKGAWVDWVANGGSRK